MILGGSQALRKWIPDWREPKDFDWIATQKEYETFLDSNAKKIVTTVPTKWGHVVHMVGSKPIEFEIAKDGNTTEQFIWLRNKNFISIDYMTPQEVYTFKMSHRYLKNSPHFKKTMEDIWTLRKLTYGDFPHYLKDRWFKERTKATYDYKHPSLKQKKDDFFSNDGVNYIYDHDTIHESVKTFDRPAFYLIKENEADVFCTKEKFYSLAEEVKLATVIEETYTLALERSQIPFNFEIDRRKSFDMAHMKVCTSITSGWWREYAWEHYYQVQAMYNEDYVDRFKQALADGIIKPYREDQQHEDHE